MNYGRDRFNGTVPIDKGFDNLCTMFCRRLFVESKNWLDKKAAGVAKMLSQLCVFAGIDQLALVAVPGMQKSSECTTTRVLTVIESHSRKEFSIKMQNSHGYILHSSL